MIYGNEYDDACLKPSVKAWRAPEDILKLPGLKEIVTEAEQDLANAEPADGEQDNSDVEMLGEQATSSVRTRAAASSGSKSAQAKGEKKKIGGRRVLVEQRASD